VRRQEYPPDSPPAVGVMWQWEGDSAGEWHPYNIEVTSLLEKAHQCNARNVDLNRHPFSLPYVVHLSSMLQIRNGTNYKRRVQRVLLPQRYMPTSSNFSHTAAVSPFTTPVFQPANNATTHGLSGLNAGVFPIPGTSQVSLGSLFFSPLFPSSLSSGLPASSISSSALAFGTSWGGGLHGGSTAAVMNASPSASGSSNVGGQKPLFTIGRTPPSGDITKKKRTSPRDLTPTSR